MAAHERRPPTDAYEFLLVSTAVGRVGITTAMAAPVRLRYREVPPSQRVVGGAEQAARNAGAGGCSERPVGCPGGRVLQSRRSHFGGPGWRGAPHRTRSRPREFEPPRGRRHAV